MLAQVIIARLREGLQTQSVFGAAEEYLARENTGYRESPAYFVTQVSEQAESYDYDETFLITQNFQVMVLIDLDCQDARGEKGFSDAQTERGKLFKQLLGWKPGDLYDHVKYVSGQLVSVEGKRMFYSFTFSVKQQIDPACDGFDGQFEWDETQLFEPKFKVSAKC